MTTALARRTPRWVAEAADLPLAFAQVREDAAVDRWVVRAVPGPCRVVMTASGGCTAAALATEPNVARLELIDTIPAQLALARLKLKLLLERSPLERFRSPLKRLGAKRSPRNGGPRPGGPLRAPLRRPARRIA